MTLLAFVPDAFAEGRCGPRADPTRLGNAPRSDCPYQPSLRRQPRREVVELRRSMIGRQFAIGWQRMADPERFQKLALHLAQGCTLRDAADPARVAERTAYRVAKNPKFRRLVRRSRS